MKTTYVYGHGLLYEVDDATGNVTYYHYDSLGSTIGLTDASANVTDRFEYSPYGAVTYRTGSTDTPFLYVGQAGVMTEHNGLLYMRARYYSPQLMRFINADPIGFAGGMNWYAYAEGNPLMYTDPTGWCGEGSTSAFSSIAASGILESTKTSNSSASKSILDVTYIEQDPTKVYPMIRDEGDVSFISFGWSTVNFKTIKSSEGFRLHATVKVSAQIYIFRSDLKNPEFIKNGVTIPGIYGHEQRHILSHNFSMKDLVVAPLSSELDSYYSNESAALKSAEILKKKYEKILRATIPDHSDYISNPNKFSPKNATPYTPLPGSPNIN